MTLLQILVFTLLGLLVGRFSSSRFRPWLLFAGSVLAIYWLQPGTPIRNLDFWFPTASLVLVISVWAITRSSGLRGLTRADLAAGLLIGLLVLAIGLTRFIEPLCCLIPTRPPALNQIVLAVLFTTILALIFVRIAENRAWLPNLFVVGLLALFVILKYVPLTGEMSAVLRSIMAQDPALASNVDIRWLGFSYVTFRLIHVLRDRVSGRLPDASLGEFVGFVIFYPAYTAGPIDRIQRFVPDLRRDFRLDSPELRSAGERLAWGIFKKFVIADTLALVALSAQNAAQIDSPAWMWFVLYLYAFVIYFDFSGYTDIAIGLGILVGIRLPENFNRPYLQKNLTQFWNAWHITLAMWFRAYYFNPLTRALRASPRKLPVTWIILFGQLSTMVLIGLWHGISWNFAIWGAWHGLGLFIHNRFSELVRSRQAGNVPNPGWSRLLDAGSVLVTFNFVALGWVWFSMPTVGLSLQTFATLFGVN
jgi:alginate O-acetyltransferase complex protein AlgI